VKPGDLVTLINGNGIGIIVDIFLDLDPINPWVRVRWTSPGDSYQWCKYQSLQMVKKKEGEPDHPFLGDTKSGSL
tara:strand:- start:546 stop:770 length:225 start_codon:yes stop_codon:yes gene_type:complete